MRKVPSSNWIAAFRQMANKRIQNIRKPETERIGPNEVKRTHYIVVKGDAISKKYIKNFISTFEEVFGDKISGDNHI